MPGELEFINWLRLQQSASTMVPVPAGDDLAVLRWAADDVLLVGADQVLDGRHFDSSLHPARLIGRKAMNRNLSDCAAMACIPVAAVATVALPARCGIDYAKELYLGMRDAADPFDCQIVGGDTASWDGKLALSVTIFGASRGVIPVRRNGALPGDSVYVSGPLGGSILGRHMTFVPQVALARQLMAIGPPTAMIDLSDGLSRDLAHLCKESNVGAVIEMSAIPIHPDAMKIAERDQAETEPPWTSAMDHALNDGEDYELLFTARLDFIPEGIVRIGAIVAEPGMVIVDRSGARLRLEPRGWEHPL